MFASFPLKRRFKSLAAAIFLLHVIIFLYFLKPAQSWIQSPARPGEYWPLARLSTRSLIAGFAVHKPVIEPLPPNKPPDNETLIAAAKPYLKAIMDPEDKHFDRFKCDAPDEIRYANLTNVPSRSGDLPKYFFALDLYKCEYVLARLLGSIVEAIRFLGTENCVLTIVEGNSDDGTFEVLSLLQPVLADAGIEYFFIRSELDTKKHRIRRLAQLRNLALKPLLDYPERFSPDTSVIFINDIAVCVNDILELVHQKKIQSADMVCAMDWTHLGDDAPPTFYDVWIARLMSGDSFFDIADDGSWKYSQNLFWNNEKVKNDWKRGKTFQVFSCWNGITVFSSRPMTENGVRFREQYKNECFQGEPNLFCKDYWLNGYGKIAVVPTVNVEYSDRRAKRLDKSDIPTRRPAKGMDELVVWEETPPALVRCMPSFKSQTWRPWDQGTSPYN